MQPWVTLLTDWGLKDHYVAQVKAGIGREIPDARIVDVCHDVPLRDVYSAAYMMADFLPCCPEGTVHLIGVRDVASIHTPHVLVKIKGQYIIGADNGFFALFFFLLKEQPESVTEIDVWQESPVLTFSVRDLFVKVAAMVVSGVPLEKIGKAGSIHNMVMDGGFIKALPERGDGNTPAGLRLVGKILFVDGMQNVVTNITREKFEECRKQFQSYSLLLRGQRVSGSRVVMSYPDVGEAEVAMIFLRNDLMEISMRGGHLAQLFGLRRNDEVCVVFKQARN